VLRIFKTVEERLFELEAFEENAWIHLQDPEDEEIMLVAEELGVEPDFLKAATDEEERARIDWENGQTLILVDVPVLDDESSALNYTTLPLGIVHTDKYIVTVCMADTTIIEDFMEERVRGFYTFKKTRFILQLLFKISAKYLVYLRQIDKVSTNVQDELQKSMKNRELLQMMQLEKSLVFFSTSLVANEAVMEKLMRTEAVKKYSEDAELLDDVIVENKQAIEMCTIYRDILSGTMDAFASIISNNLNVVMKFLAAATIILSVPTLIASIWGMNVRLPFMESPIGFWAVLGIACAAAGITIWLLWKKKML
jgi:magnesium transporter